MNQNLEMTPEQALTAAKVVIAALTPLVVWLMKEVAPRLPKGLLPAATPAIGLMFGYILNWLGFGALGATDAAISGALGVAVREIWDQNFQSKDRDGEEKPQKKI